MQNNNVNPTLAQAENGAGGNGVFGAVMQWF
jgi:hypothetical protein